MVTATFDVVYVKYCLWFCTPVNKLQNVYVESIKRISRSTLSTIQGLVEVRVMHMRRFQYVNKVCTSCICSTTSQGWTLCEAFEVIVYVYISVPLL